MSTTRMSSRNNSSTSDLITFRVRTLLRIIKQLLLIGFLLQPVVVTANLIVPLNTIEKWAETFGQTITAISSKAMALTDIQTDYLLVQPTVRPINGSQLVQEMKRRVEETLNKKQRAVERIVERAEKAHAKHIDEIQQISYPKAKNLSSNFTLRRSDHFNGVPVNVMHSTVHVPTNVFDESGQVLNGVAWSAALDETFEQNYRLDPTLTWQYFGSSTGFFRIYPGIEWPKNGVDLYDCRTRGWYIQAATSSKDMVILLDTSGSMTGLRMEIAKATVEKIVETLSEDDFFNVIKFSDTTEYLDSCFNGTLVQATRANKQRVGERLREKKIKTHNIALFDKALAEAFQLLFTVNETGGGAQCNKAIMLITDGAPDTFESLFQRFNWPNRDVRVFTYLIGREVGDTSNVRAIACNNKGIGYFSITPKTLTCYYSHISTLADVHEHVQDFVLTLSRPMVVHGAHESRWTDLYPAADFTTPRLSSIPYHSNTLTPSSIPSPSLTALPSFVTHLTSTPSYVATARGSKEMEGRGRLRRHVSGTIGDNNDDIAHDFSIIVSDVSVSNASDVIKEEKDREVTSSSSSPVDPLQLQVVPFNRSTRRDPATNSLQHSTRNIELTISVAQPVFDTKNGTTNSGILLGVAGTDVPLTELIRLIPHHKLGVNGYALATNNNGYILFHPDLRPLHEGDVKLNYNSVDISQAELEYTDDSQDEDPETVSPDLNLALRRVMINRETGQITMRTLSPSDNHRRVSLRSKSYYFAPIDNSPFSLAVVLPTGYGLNSIDGRRSLKDADLWSLRTGDIALAPWIYCTLDVEEFHTVPRSDVLIKLFERSRAQPELYSERCNEGLVEGLLWDAEVTRGAVESWRKENTEGIPNDNVSKSDCTHPPCTSTVSLPSWNGVEIVFLGTKSGLTRYLALTENLTEPDFITNHAETIHETYYRRAAEGGDGLFTFSVPFHPIYSGHDADTPNMTPVDVNSTVVTVSTPIVIAVDNADVIASVVGLQMKYVKFHEMLVNVTSRHCLFFSSPSSSSPLTSSSSSSLSHGGSHSSPWAGGGSLGGESGARHDSQCNITCESEEVECYLLDENGYILFSKEPHLQLGRYFGHVQPAVMAELVDVEEVQEEEAGEVGEEGEEEGGKVNERITGSERVFKRLYVNDYQASCAIWRKGHTGGASSIFYNPYRWLTSAISAILHQIAALFLWHMDFVAYCSEYQSEIVNSSQSDYYADEDGGGAYGGQGGVRGGGDSDGADESQLRMITRINKLAGLNRRDLFHIWLNEFRQMVLRNDPPHVWEIWFQGLESKYTPQITGYKPCTIRHTVYVARPAALPYSGHVSSCQLRFGCNKGYSVNRVPGTNLMLVVVDATCPCDGTSNDDSTSSVHQVVGLQPTELTFVSGWLLRCTEKGLHSAIHIIHGRIRLGVLVTVYTSIAMVPTLLLPSNGGRP